MSFDEIFDLTAEVYFNFYNIIFWCIPIGHIMGWHFQLLLKIIETVFLGEVCVELLNASTRLILR